MTKKSFHDKELVNNASTQLCVISEDDELDFSASLPDTSSRTAANKTEFSNTADPSFADADTKNSYPAPIRRSCSLDPRPLPGSSRTFKIGTAMRSLPVAHGSLPSGVKRKRSENDNTGPSRKRQKMCYPEQPTPERGVKRKHSSDHTESEHKRLKIWHKTDPPNIIIPCPSTCVCHVGQSKIIPIKRRDDTATSLLKEVLEGNLYMSASELQLDCCEKRCFYIW